ncbi:cytochrome P450 [Nocardia yamanashiensis]|uniref:cytochrome P450 n=1 Tax=Nocardia yamanashiensis TaxID=209247 RepID=UPI00083055C7|nr:cytochrome P450 [Nocardia yamanashiensis]
MPVPVEHLGPRIPLYAPEFAADPHTAYRRMRRDYGSLVPIELAPGVPATLVIKYRTAVRILNDPDHFPADPRGWQATVPPDLDFLPMVEWRPNALRSDGGAHKRYRTATTDALAGLDPHRLRSEVEQVAIPLINTFCGDGHAELISQYILPLVFSMINRLLGCPAHIGERVARASAAMFEGVDTATVNAMLNGALLELTHLKRQSPAEDVTTRLVMHPAELTDDEMIHQLVTHYSAGVEIPQNLIANTLLLMLTDSRFAPNEAGFAPPTADAIDEILATDPPLANYCLSYPRHPILVDNVWLPATQPVIISMAACSNDPEMNNGEYARNGWNLAWSAGPHACPGQARIASVMIVQEAIDQLFDALPELRLAMPAEQLTWRPGPFHRALAAFPINFPPSPPLTIPTGGLH